MTEQKVKKRGWVKNAAIIFLSVMLVLTFFSNTIMNHSLPEAAVEYVHSGTIAAKIRGSGTVSANESFEVKSEQTREVLSVPIKVGDEVEVGDTLLLYAEGESSQIKDVEDALDALMLDYQTALIDSGGEDYAKEKRDIELAQKELNKAKAERNDNDYTPQALAAAKAAVSRAKQDTAAQEKKLAGLNSTLAELNKKLADLEKQLAGMSPYEDNVDRVQLEAKRNELAAAKKSLDALVKAHKDIYGNLEDLATRWWRKDNGKAVSEKPSAGELETYVSALIRYLEVNLDVSSPDASKDAPLPFDDGGSKVNEKEADSMMKAYTAIQAEKDKVAAINREISAIQNVQPSGNSEYNATKKKVDEAQKNVDSAQNNVDAAQKILDDLKEKQAKAEEILKEIEEKKEKFESADKLVEEKQLNLENLMFELEQTKKNDGKQDAKDALALADKRKKIEQKKEELNELKAGGSGALLESKVNGIVKTVDITAGNTAEVNQTLMTIEVPDRGYGINIPVTIEQSKNVKVGDAAEVTNNYWGSNITATLVGIKSDPQNPNTGKMLYFRLEGDVESGSQLGISIGERGANYESIVPNSAIRTDNNGDFVLAVTTKNNAFSNRYVAQRVDIKVLAKDDVNSAVSGGLSYNDFVITTSTKPIESGMQVRLPD